MTDSEFNSYMRSLPRELSEEEVADRERLHDYLNGLWVGNQADHHEYGEAAH